MQCASPLKAAPWPFTVFKSTNSGTFELLQNNPFSNFCFTMNDSSGFALKNWENQYERPFVLWDESSSLLFQQPNTWQCEYKLITDSSNSSSSFHSRLFPVFIRMNTVWMGIPGIEKRPLNALTSALLKDYLFLFYFSRLFCFVFSCFLSYIVLDFTFTHNLFSLR